MSLLWKKYTITFELQTKDNQKFRYATVDFEQKRNWYWLVSENISLHRCVLDCIKEFFKIWIDLKWIYEGENPNRLIDEKKLELVNKHIRTIWINDYQSSLKHGKIRNIELTYLIR